MAELEQAFSALLKRQATDEEIQRLYQVRDALGLRPNDALWQVLIALEWYQQQYQRFPQEISKACEVVLAKVTDSANSTAKAAAEEAKRELSKAVGKAVASVSRGASWKELARWFCGCAVAIAALIGGTAWWSYHLGVRAAEEAGRARTAWADTEEGRAAFELARSGTLRTIVRCEGPGWQLREGKCFPQPVGGTVYGWDVPTLATLEQK